ncbi:MAG TPA: hypothetical protein DEA90_14735 [Opitutae bacterium]|nr:hypothetical protein [Opitutae bacterium]|tara:strand:- start:6697 stop:7299 length:603 start_codon:yes stop_codon:yes gene_type:complete
MDPATDYPHNGANALVPGSISSGTLELGQDTRLTNFNILAGNSFSLDLSGFTLEVSGQLNTNGTSNFIDGDLIVADYLGETIRLYNTNAHFDQAVFNGAGIQMFDNSKFVNNHEVQLSGTSSAISSDSPLLGSPSEFENNGTLIRDSINGGNSNISATVTGSGGQVITESGDLTFSEKVQLYDTEFITSTATYFGASTLN